MKVIEVNVTDKQMDFIKKKAGKKSVRNVLTEWVMSMIDRMIRQEEKDNGTINAD